MFGLPQLLRFTLPIATSPDVPSGYVSGLGDLTLMDIFILPTQGDIPIRRDRASGLPRDDCVMSV